jgi:hypothetical protein
MKVAPQLVAGFHSAAIMYGTRAEGGAFMGGLWAIPPVIAANYAFPCKPGSVRKRCNDVAFGVFRVTCPLLETCEKCMR